jgi:hypothetical protein
VGNLAPLSLSLSLELKVFQGANTYNFDDRVCNIHKYEFVRIILKSRGVVGTQVYFDTLNWQNHTGVSFIFALIKIKDTSYPIDRNRNGFMPLMQHNSK